jgi:hypothetical protein
MTAARRCTAVDADAWAQAQSPRAGRTLPRLEPGAPRATGVRRAEDLTLTASDPSRIAERNVLPPNDLGISLLSRNACSPKRHCEEVV